MSENYFENIKVYDLNKMPDNIKSIIINYYYDVDGPQALIYNNEFPQFSEYLVEYNEEFCKLTEDKNKIKINQWLFQNGCTDNEIIILKAY